MSNRATQIRQKRGLVTLAISHRVLSDTVTALADGIEEAKAIFIDGSTRVCRSPGLWEQVAVEMYQALEAALPEEELRHEGA